MRRPCAGLAQATQHDEVELVANLGAKLADLAVLGAPPTVRKRGSGTNRKLCARLRSIVGDYVSNDIVRAILAASVQHDALVDMHLIILQAKNNRLEEDVRLAHLQQRG